MALTGSETATKIALRPIKRRAGAITAASIGLEKYKSRMTGPASTQIPIPAGIAMSDAIRSADAAFCSNTRLLRVAQAAETAGSRLMPMVAVRGWNQVINRNRKT